MNKKYICFVTFCSIAICSTVVLIGKVADYAQSSAMSRRIQLNLGKLWGPESGDILARGFTRDDRNNWFESINELAAYLKKAKSPLASNAYTTLFNDYISELEQASLDLFNAVQLIFNSQIQTKKIVDADLVLLKTAHDKLKAHEKKLQELSKQLANKKFTDLKSTKEIKQTFLAVLRPFERMYQKALEEISAMRTAVRLRRDVEASLEAGRKKAEAAKKAQAAPALT